MVRTTAKDPDVVDLKQERPPFLSFKLILNDDRATEGEFLRLGVKKVAILE